MIFKTSLIALLFCITVNVNASHPLFINCEAKSSSIENCSADQYLSFLKQGEASVRSSLGVIVRDSVFVSYKIKKNGKIKILSSYSRVSKLLKRACEEWTQTLWGKVKRQGEQSVYHAAFRFQIPPLKAIDVNECDVSPTLINCLDFNAAGQRSCLDYLLSDEIGELMLRQYEGYAEMELLFDPRGKLIAIDFQMPARNQALNDSLISRILKIAKYITVTKEVSQVHFNRYYSIRGSYNFFFSAVSERTYFEREAEKLFAARDTSRLVRHIIRTGMDLTWYSSFVKHCEKFKQRYGLQGSEFIETCLGKRSIDSLISRAAAFDEKTDSIIGVRHVTSHPGECANSDSLGLCTNAFIENYLSDNLSGSNLNLNDSLFARVFRGSVFPNNTSMVFYFETDGSLNRVRLDIFSPTYVDGKLINAYFIPMEDQHMLNIMFIEILSELPDFIPATVDGFDCYDKFTAKLTLGEN